MRAGSTTASMISAALRTAGTRGGVNERYADEEPTPAYPTPARLINAGFLRPTSLRATETSVPIRNRSTILIQSRPPMKIQFGPIPSFPHRGPQPHPRPEPAA